MYLRLKVSGLRADYYFNRKACDNKDRGHFAIENGEVVFNRAAPALGIMMLNGSPSLSVSGSLLLSIQDNIQRILLDHAFVGVRYVEVE
ncbi:MAG: hypothetical protein RL557_1036 [archaeon]